MFFIFRVFVQSTPFVYNLRLHFARFFEIHNMRVTFACSVAQYRQVYNTRLGLCSAFALRQHHSPMRMNTSRKTLLTEI